MNGVGVGVGVGLWKMIGVGEVHSATSTPQVLKLKKNLYITYKL